MDKQGKLIALFLFFRIVMAMAQQTDVYFNTADSFFKTYVTDGKVDYNRIKANPSSLKNLVEMAKRSRVSINNMDQYKAFWINTYNLLVISGIVAYYPLNSPLEVEGFFDQKLFEVGGRSITLNGIENELLRAKFPNEPRFHFVLVCAGLGCPPIINEVYRPQTLESKLQLQTERALNDPNFIQVVGNKVYVSQIFEWYKGDFENAGGVATFINSYRKIKLPDAPQINYYQYDWTLNSMD